MSCINTCARDVSKGLLTQPPSLFAGPASTTCPVAGRLPLEIPISEISNPSVLDSILLSSQSTSSLLCKVPSFSCSFSIASNAWRSACKWLKCWARLANPLQYCNQSREVMVDTISGSTCSGLLSTYPVVKWRTPIQPCSRLCTAYCDSLLANGNLFLLPQKKKTVG